MLKPGSLRSILEKETLSFIFACTCLVILPVWIWYLPPFMVLWGLSRILESQGKGSLRVSFISYETWLFILFIVFYFWQLIGIIYSENTKTGWNIFLSRLSLFLFPFVLIAPGERIIRNIKLLLKLFAGSTTIFILFCFAYAFLKSVSFQNGLIVYNPHPPDAYWTTYYYGSYFSVNQHPSYLSMYVILSLFIAFESWFDKNIKTGERVFWLITGVFLLISIYFLSSRSGILASIIIVPVYFSYKLKQKQKRKGLIIIFSILVILFALFLVIRSNERVKLVLNEISNGSLKKKAIEDGRVIIWRSALRIIRNNLFLGVGIGDVRTELMKEYKSIGNQDLIENNYNVHNQFLEVLLENGLVGFILFLTILGYMSYLAICQQNLLSGLFIIMMIIFFMFESVLDRFAGIAFFPLFSFLLIHLESKSRN